MTDKHTLVERLHNSDWGPNVTDALTRWAMERAEAATRITALEAREAELVERLTECAVEIRVMSEWASGPTAETYTALHSKCAATLAKHQEGEG